MKLYPSRVSTETETKCVPQEGTKRTSLSESFFFASISVHLGVQNPM
jgi:hypothetical protein